MPLNKENLVKPKIWTLILPDIGSACKFVILKSFIWL